MNNNNEIQDAFEIPDDHVSKHLMEFVFCLEGHNETILHEWMNHQGFYCIYNLIDAVIQCPYYLQENSEYVDSKGENKILPNFILHNVILIVFWSTEWSTTESFLTLKTGLLNLKKQDFECWAHKSLIYSELLIILPLNHIPIQEEQAGFEENDYLNEEKFKSEFDEDDEECEIYNVLQSVQSIPDVTSSEHKHHSVLCTESLNIQPSIQPNLCHYNYSNSSNDNPDSHPCDASFANIKTPGHDSEQEKKKNEPIHNDEEHLILCESLIQPTSELIPHWSQSPAFQLTTDIWNDHKIEIWEEVDEVEILIDQIEIQDDMEQCLLEMGSNNMWVDRMKKGEHNHYLKSCKIPSTQFKNVQSGYQLLLKQHHHQGSNYLCMDTGDHMKFMLTSTPHKIQTWDPGGFYNSNFFILCQEYSNLEKGSHNISTMKSVSSQTNQPKGSCTIFTIHAESKQTRCGEKCCCLANLLCATILVETKSRKLMKLRKVLRNYHDRT